MFGYLKKHDELAFAIDTNEVDYLDLPETKYDWEEYYSEAKEDFPSDLPKPEGKKEQMTCFVDASHADDEGN